MRKSWRWSTEENSKRIVSVQFSIMLNYHVVPKDIAAGANHSIILRNDGNCYGFGSNEYGQLGYKNEQ